MVVTEASALSNETITDYAELIGARYEIYEGCWADVEGLVQRLGGTVQTQRDFESLQVRRPGDFTVYVPAFTNKLRDRFTIAHELGHYCLHYVVPKRQDVGLFWRGGEGRAEQEADLFAASLLMPRETFIQACRQHRNDWWQLAVLFEIAPAAAKTRAEYLGIADS
jgi:hypothetical protein